jgi:hypothetical protein
MKSDARFAQEQRLRTAAQEARARRATMLRAQFALAQRKRAARQSELGRQAELAHNRPAEPTPEASATVLAAKSQATAKDMAKDKAKDKKAPAAKPLPRAQAKRHGKGVSTGTGLTNTGGMHAKKQSKKPTRGAGKPSAAVSGKGEAAGRELLSRQ